MPKLKDYRNFTRDLPIELSTGATLTISYRPAAYSGEFQKRVTKEGGNLADEDFLAEILASWDFTGDDDKPVPVTKAVIMKEISIPDRSIMVRTIFSDIFPTEPAETTETAEN